MEIGDTFNFRQFATALNTSFEDARVLVKVFAAKGFIGRVKTGSGPVATTFRFSESYRGREMFALLFGDKRSTLIEELGLEPRLHERPLDDPDGA